MKSNIILTIISLGLFMSLWSCQPAKPYYGERAEALARVLKENDEIID